MPITGAIQRNSLSSHHIPQKSYAVSSQNSIEIGETNGNNVVDVRLSHRRASEISKKTNIVSKNLSTANTSATKQSKESRSSITCDKAAIRARSKSDMQTILYGSNGLKQQQQLPIINGCTNEKIQGNQSQQQVQSIQKRPKCTLPVSSCQSGYVTPSKLFNMMGYGLDNQYLLMHAHYLYIIDCRSREKFDESHIITGKKSHFFL